MTGHVPTPLIGIDGGGSSCRVAVLVGDTRHEVMQGPANVSTDFEGAMTTVRMALAEAGAAAGLNMKALSQGTAYVGLAGVVSPAIARRVANLLPMRCIAVTDDRPTTIAGALGESDGAVAAIGTGSFVGRQVDGRIAGVGGWGFHIGDQASGAWLVRRALEDLMLAVDGLAPMTALGRTLLAEHDGDTAAIVEFSLRAKPVEYSQLAVGLVAAAETGDPLAARLMREGADYIRRALERLGWDPSEPLCLTGGLGPAYARWLGLGSVPPRGSALDGALTLARRLERQQA
jgi:glucosamine kinase